MIACAPTIIVAEGDTGGEEPPPGPMTDPPSPGTSTTTSPPPPRPTSSSTTTNDPGTSGRTTGANDESSPITDRGFIDTCCDDGGHTPYECDTFAQDCPDGEKCMPWSNDGGDDWNATKCAPIQPTPDLIGEPCVVEGSAVSGVDTCELGAMCFFVDAATNAGTCVALCAGDLDDPICEGIDTCIMNEEQALTVCLEECDPTAAGCATGNQCAPGFSRFLCTPYPSGAGAYGTSCEPFGCESGLSCQDPSAVSPSCDQTATGCCTTYCDTAGAPCSEAGQSCEPYYAPGEAAEGYEHIGLCLTV